MIALYDALEKIGACNYQPQIERFNVEESLGCISAIEIKATLALPSFDNSAMDGYAVGGVEEPFEIIDKIFAGSSKECTLKPHQAARIFTGAKVPQDSYSVIPQEIATANKNQLTLQKSLQKGANIRRKGEDIDIGETILKVGDRITSAHIALLASQGITELEIFRKPKVAVFASGSELKLPGEDRKEGEVYNSNTPYLIARTKEFGAEATFIGKSQDSLEAIITLIQEALDGGYDLIVTSGGVSVGEADFTKEAFASLGMKEHFSRVAVKPGKPTTFGKIDHTFILNLPGNPLASALNFEIFGKFLIKKLSGERLTHPDFILTPLLTSVQNPRDVTNLIPGNLTRQGFQPLAKFAPGSVNALNLCNGFIAVDETSKSIEEGELVKFLPINWDLSQEDFERFTS